MDKGQAAMEVSLAGDAPWAEAPAGYKRTEVGVIPQEWTLGRLADFGVFRSGSGFPLVYQGLPSGDYPFFKVSDMNNQGNELFMKVANHWIDEEVRKKLGAAKHPIGSIVFAKIGAAIFLERKRLLSQASCIDNNMMAFSLRDHHACQQFFYYLFLDLELGKLVSTTALPSLSGRQIGAIRVPVPPSDEQRAIAEALSDVDGQLSALGALIAKKRSIKRATMQQLVTGKIRLSGFSREWQMKRLGDVLTVRHGRSQQGIGISDGRYPIFASGGEIGRTNSFLYAHPSVLIGRKGTIDNPQFASSPFWATDTLLYTEIADGISVKFIFYKFCMIPWQKYNEASGLPSLNAQTIESIEIDLPDIEEQAAIAAVLSDIDGEITALGRHRDKTRTLKQGMMQQLLIGQIRLVEQR